MRQLNTSLRSPAVRDLRAKFASRLVGQQDAVEAFTNCLEKYVGHLNDPHRPIASLLFLGPTGTGKTSAVETLCESLYGDAHRMIKIDCGEFQHSHEIAKLIGSPPGYLGHRETAARLTNEAIVACQTADTQFTVILFDEIEKASDSLWNLLLSVLDKGVLTLGNNTTTNFCKTIIVMTSNVGARSMAKAVGDGALGFQSSCVDEYSEKEMKEISLSAARKAFMPEFLNRLDEIVMFNTLTKEQIGQVLEMELHKIFSQMILKVGILVSVSPAAKRELLLRGYDKKYNARGIRRTLEKEIMTPIARSAASGEVQSGSALVVDYKEGAFLFWCTRESQSAFAGLGL